MNDQYRDLERAAFDSFDEYDGDSYDPNTNMYDPSLGMYDGDNYEDNYEDSYDGDNYEPDNYGNKRRPKRGQPGSKIMRSPLQAIPKRAAAANFDLTIRSNFSAGLYPSGFNTQLFAPLFTVAEVQDASVNDFVPLMSGDAGQVANLALNNPVTAVTTIFGSIADKGGNYKYCYFSKSGELIWEEKNGVTTYQCIIQCKQIPYRALLKWLQSGSFRINRMRLNYTQSDQIDQEFKWFDKVWLGSERKNTVTPRNYFSPDQFQSLIVDVPVGFNIDKQKGFTYVMSPIAGSATQNVVSANVAVSLYTGGTL